MNPADIAIAVIITISVLIGLVRGFVVEVLALVVWAAAVVLAMSFGEVVAALFESTVSLPSARYALGYLSVFFGVLLVGALFVWLMRKVVQGTGLSGTDRMLGMVFGLLRGAVVVVVLVLILSLTPITRDTWWQESRAVPTFRSLAQMMVRWLPASLAEYFDTGALGGRVESAVFGAIDRDEPRADDTPTKPSARPGTRKPVPATAPERKPD